MLLLTTNRIQGVPTVTDTVRVSFVIVTDFISNIFLTLYRQQRKMLCKNCLTLKYPKMRLIHTRHVWSLFLDLKNYSLNLEASGIYLTDLRGIPSIFAITCPCPLLLINSFSMAQRDALRRDEFHLVSISQWGWHETMERCSKAVSPSCV